MSDARTVQLLRLAAAISFIFVIVNHLMPPSVFAGSQLLFDYDQGFIRRGLAGELLGPMLGPTVSVGEIYLAAALITLTAAAILYIFLIRNLGGTVVSFLLMILVFDSFAFASFIGTTGYLDGVLLALVLLALSTNGAGTLGLLLRLAVCVIGILVHEAMLPYFTVLIGFELWIVRGAGRGAVLPALLPVAVGFMTVAVLSVIGEHDAAQAQAFLAGLNQRIEYTLPEGIKQVVRLSLTDNFELMRDMRSQPRYWNWWKFDGTPLILMSLWLIWLNMKLLGREASILTKILCLGAITAPFSLNLIAFDVVRFGVMAVLNGFIVAALLVRHLPGARERLTQVLTWPVFVILLIINANIFTMQVNQTENHLSQFPWIFVKHLEWLQP